LRQDFDAAVDAAGHPPLRRAATTTLQVNVGKLCNMSCRHCHVDAGPRRTEIMSGDTVDRLLVLLAASPGVSTVDLTGGAPELNPHFRRLVVAARALGRRVIDRCNLSVLFEPGQEDLGEFLVAHEVEVVASLPCYLEANVDKQRGAGAFDNSIEGIRLLNRLGYGQPGSRLRLSLVYNPTGPSLPPAQAGLAADYHRVLKERYDLVFHDLLTITNMPIARFANQLRADGRLASYEDLLRASFNPDTLPALMCRSLVSVSWDGRLFDCDFHQMTEVPLGAGLGTVYDVHDLEGLRGTPIATRSHCFGCTAGAGSSCGGALA